MLLTRKSQRGWKQRLVYSAFRVMARLTGVACLGLRCFGRENMPHQGAVLVCSNHQSTLDPVLLGLTFDRRLNYLARKSLFRFAPFGWLIDFLDAIPIDREGGGLAGLKEALRRLRRGEMVLIFPEGTRSRDGEVGSLETGFCALARRGEVTLLPVGIDGAFQAWPRSAWLPSLAMIHIRVGTPIAPPTVKRFSDEMLVQELERRIKACHADARASRLR